jgi:CheY-like chemotaxis protein
MKALRSLLIDDEPNARARLRFLLEDEEPERVEIIAEAKDGLEAVAAIEKLRPDLIFLDIQMPGLDGFGVLKALSPNFPIPLIIFVTGFMSTLWLRSTRMLLPICLSQLSPRDSEKWWTALGGCIISVRIEPRMRES